MYKILNANENNANDIYNLASKCFTYEKLSIDSINDYIFNKTNIDYVKVLYDEEVFSGFIIYRINDIAELLCMAVDENKRRMGYGDLLIKLMLYTIDTYNYDKVIGKEYDEYKDIVCRKVLLEVRSKNESAISLYKKNGFNVIDTRKGYYKDPIDDCYVMERMIQ